MTPVLNHSSPVIKCAGSQIRVHLPISSSQSFHEFSASHSQRLLLWILNPLLGQNLEFLDGRASLIEESLLCGFLLEKIVFTHYGLNVVIYPRVIAAKFFSNVTPLDKFFKLLYIFGEVDLASDNRVEPAFNNLPDTCIQSKDCAAYHLSYPVWLTMEYPRGLMHQYGA